MRRFLLNPRGVAILKIMLAMVLASGLIVIDMERRQKNIINSRRLASIQTITQIEENLKLWLSLPDTVSYSFGEDSNAIGVGNGNPGGRQIKVFESTTTTAQIPDPSPTIPPTDEDLLIQKIVVPSVASSAGDRTFHTYLAQTTIVQTPRPNFNLIGYPPLQSALTGATLPLTSMVEGLDGKGWSYIRAMWIDNFSAINGPTNPSIGSGELKVLVWTFNNIIDADLANNSSVLNCQLNNNCSQQILSIRLQLNIETNSRLVMSGAYGLDCTRDDNGVSTPPILRIEISEVADACSPSSPPDPPNGYTTQYFFRVIDSSINAQGTSLLDGHCCKQLN